MQKGESPFGCFYFISLLLYIYKYFQIETVSIFVKCGGISAIFCSLEDSNLDTMFVYLLDIATVLLESAEEETSYLPRLQRVLEEIIFRFESRKKEIIAPLSEFLQNLKLNSKRNERGGARATQPNSFFRFQSAGADLSKFISSLFIERFCVGFSNQFQKLLLLENTWESNSEPLSVQLEIIFLYMDITKELLKNGSQKKRAEEEFLPPPSPFQPKLRTTKNNNNKQPKKITAS